MEVYHCPPLCVCFFSFLLHSVHGSLVLFEIGIRYLTHHHC
jgi:hypothetical protein